MKITILSLPVILLLGFSTASGASLEQLEQCWNKSHEYLGLVESDDDGNSATDPHYRRKLMNDSECYALKGTLEKANDQKIECFYIKAASGYKCGKNAKEFQSAQIKKPKLGKNKDGFYVDWVSEKPKYSPSNFKDEIQKVLPSKQSTPLNYEIGFCIHNKSRGYNLSHPNGYHPEMVKACICLSEYYAKSSSYDDFESNEQAHELRDAAYKNGVADKCFEGVRKAVLADKEKPKKNPEWDEYSLKKMCIPRTVILKKKPAWNLKYAPELFEKMKEEYLKQLGSKPISLEEIDQQCLKYALKNICKKDFIHETGVSDGYFVWGLEDLRAYLGESLTKENYKKHCK